MLPSRSLVTGVKALEPRRSGGIRLALEVPNTITAMPTKQCRQSLGGLEELGGGDCVIIGGINGDIIERPLDGIEPSSARRKGRHGGRCER
jgi:hypothetical protein